MRVMTMDGGFRGLQGGLGGPITQAQRNASTVWFTDRLVGLDEQLDRLQESREAGLLPAADAERLLSRYGALNDRIGAHLAALERFTDDVSIASWRTVGEAIVRDVRTWVNDVRRIIGDERAGRALRFVLLLSGTAVLFGGTAYVIWRRYH